MSKPQTTIPVSSKSEDVREVTYRLTYRDCFNMESTFTKDHAYIGSRDAILLQVKYEMGHYGGLKAELIKGDME